MNKPSIVQTVIFISGTLVAPLLLIFVNFVIRSIKKWYYTSGSDILYFLFMTNISLVILSADVSPLIKKEVFREALISIYIILALLTLISWLLVVEYVEVYINKEIAAGRLRKSIGIVRSFFSWTAVLVFLTLNLGVIFYP